MHESLIPQFVFGILTALVQALECIDQRCVITHRKSKIHMVYSLQQFNDLLGTRQYQLNEDMSTGAFEYQLDRSLRFELLFVDLV